MLRTFLPIGPLPVCSALLAWALLAAGPAAAEELSGEQVYQQQCARCHGRAGEGVEEHYAEPLVGDRSVAQLAAVIEKTMPEDTEQKCSAADAQKVAAYIYDAFYSPDAQVRNKPARVELSRLTVRQYQNAVTDLIGSFRSHGEWGTERGLRAEYYRSRRFGKENRKIERIDPAVEFNFGTASPDAEKIEAHEFSIRWEGSVLAPDTGDYEFVVRTEHAARLWVNDLQQPLVDAWVKSGDETEYRGSLRLLGGRPYALKLEFSKAKQGVDDSAKDKDKPKPEVQASVALLWKRPHHTLAVIPARHLSVKNAPEVFVLHTPFPPDDRSIGYERGTTISKAWDQATTDAALEVADYVATRLDQLAQADPTNPEHEPKLREFCQRFVERAFRRPLTDEQKQLYLDRQFAEAADRLAAVKRVVLLALKSPRFLYREVGSESPSAYDVASRLSFGLWDSIPDEPLLKAAAENQLANREHIDAQLNRMLGDVRTRSKLRGVLMDWLKVSQPPDLSKDSQNFPEFTPEVASDLRTSLELTLDDLLTSEAGDFRQLLLGDAIYLNGRLAKVYGAPLPENAPFEKVAFEADRRSGVLSHPYLLAGFAYTNTSSPIHRGVFISRSLLGRTLRPPPDAVAPLAPDLHAELTTRERVALQTQAAACQTCHTMINPLGFTLEHFDALGRYREVEKEKPIDAAGSYLTRSGEVAQFTGVRELANFLANSEEAHQAFIKHLFHQAVKQPIQAYSTQQVASLKQAFVDSQYNVQQLFKEIVAAGALPSPTTQP
jgi:cytochrome c553